MNRGRPKRGKMSPSACGEDNAAAPHVFYLPLICCGASRYSTTLQRLLLPTQYCLFLESPRHPPKPPKRLCFTGRAVAVEPHRHGSGFRHQLPLDERECSGPVYENVQLTLVTPQLGIISRTETRVALIAMAVERRPRDKLDAVTHATTHVGASY